MAAALQAELVVPSATLVSLTASALVGQASWMTDDCEFCDIVSGRAPALFVAEWDTAVAFFPLNPATVGHTLVVPRRHVADLWSADADLAAVLIQHVLEIAHQIRTALTPGGMNIINSAGRVATQTIMHLHVHVVPRYSDDAMGEIWPEGSPVAEADTSAALDQIRAAPGVTLGSETLWLGRPR